MYLEEQVRTVKCGLWGGLNITSDAPGKNSPKSALSSFQIGRSRISRFGSEQFFENGYRIFTICKNKHSFENACKSASVDEVASPRL